MTNMPPAIAPKTICRLTADAGDGLGVDVELVLGVQHAADAGHAGGNQRDAELRARDVDADGGGGVFLLADGFER